MSDNVFMAAQENLQLSCGSFRDLTAWFRDVTRSKWTDMQRLLIPHAKSKHLWLTIRYKFQWFMVPRCPLWPNMHWCMATDPWHGACHKQSVASVG